MSKRTVGKLSRDYKPVESEEQVLRWWKTSKAYQRTKKRLLKKPKFYFLDGPPYVTNPPHVGTAWNKTLKDVLIRFWRMRGYNVHDQPGFDCHGLPIEVQVEKKLNLSSKKDIEQVFGIDRFITECKKYAAEYVDIQTRVFEDLGVWMDWNHPYITYEDPYVESVWWTIKQAEKKGLLYKGVKVVHWCSHDETALAGYEVTDEYRTIKDYSIYVKLPLVDKQKEFLVIWTTTPWTLPANLAVMVHPDKTYVRAEVDGEHLIIAKERVSAVLGTSEHHILDEFLGRTLEGAAYKPPLMEETNAKTGGKLHRVVLSTEHVSMAEGTGLVHTAPGHGEEDYEVGQQYGLPVFSPVDQAGRFTSEVGKYAGLAVREANPVIIKDLEAKHLLFKEETFEHSYPHCWRCKTPLILRATDQWFIKVTAFKKQMISENRKVDWTPGWAGSKRFHDWLSGARDWLISRQRYWNTPLPVWTCKDCGKRTVVASRAELVKVAIDPPKDFDLHRNGVDQIVVRCKCGGTAKREPDVVDVWLDSGVASWASLGYPPDAKELRAWWPADAIIEAHDQTRGWFYNQLGSSILVFNKAPFRSVMMHGHTLDPEGEKMSKSKGNFANPADVIAKYGRDALRFYTLQSTVWEDFRFSWGTVESVARDLQIVWNVFAFATLYMSLDKFTPARSALRGSSRSYRGEDRWLLSRTERLVHEITEHNEKMEFHVSARALREFLVEDVSHWYIRLVRRRFWQEKNSPDKLAAYTVLNHALTTWLSLSAPMIPFSTETIYRQSFRNAHRDKNLESVHMTPWPRPNRAWINNRLEEDMRIARSIAEASASARQSKKMKLRQPVSEILVVSEVPTVKRAMRSQRELLVQQTNSKRIRVVTIAEAEQLKTLTVEPNFKELGPIFRGEANQIAQALRVIDGRQLLAAFKRQNQFQLNINQREYNVTGEMVSLKEEMPDNYAVGTFDGGRVYVDLTIPTDLVREGFVREVIRRLQEMRKRLDLPVDAFVDGFISSSNAEKLEWLEDEKETIMEEVRARELILQIDGQKQIDAALKEEWLIGSDEFHMGLSQQPATT